MALNERMLPIGKKKTTRTGDYLYTWEVVGWNDKAKCNIWEEVSKRYSPATRINYARAVEMIEDSIEHEHALYMARNIKKRNEEKGGEQ